MIKNIGIIGGGWLKFSFFPPIEAEVIQVEVTFPLGTPIDVTSEAIDKIQKAAISTDLHFQDTKNQKLFLSYLYQFLRLVFLIHVHYQDRLVKRGYKFFVFLYLVLAK